MDRVPQQSENSTTDAIAEAMAAARAAQGRWASTPMKHRLALVRELRALIADEAWQLAASSADARQRPAIEALTSEVFPLAEACRFLERNAKRVLASRHVGVRGFPFSGPMWLPNVVSKITREPFGVVLVIGPGNFPLMLAGIQMMQALVAGNAVLLKPGVGGTAAASALLALMHQAGFDPKLAQLLPESVEAAQAAIAAHPDKVVFTGSAATGANILTQLAPQLIPATMELSGCDAVMVRADADMELLTKALVFGLTLNGGATCIAPKRVFVHASRMAGLEQCLSDALRPNGDHAPRRDTLPERVHALIDDAIARGARILAGSIPQRVATTERSAALPLVLSNVAPNSRILREDIFAPVLAIISVANDEEAITHTNDCPFALGASIFSSDTVMAQLLARRVRTGVVTINDLIIPTADARLPFGGVRSSGFGTTRGAEGLLELTTPKVVTMTGSKFRPGFGPVKEHDARLFTMYMRLTHGRGIRQRLSGLMSMWQRTDCAEQSRYQRHGLDVLTHPLQCLLPSLSELIGLGEESATAQAVNIVNDIIFG